MVNSDDFVILTEKGLAFIKEWFGIAIWVPSDLTREYQMLVHICCYGGSIKYVLLREIGYKDDTLRKALEQKFIIISKDSSKLEDNVKIEIAKMIGKPPSILYT